MALTEKSELVIATVMTRTHRRIRSVAAMALKYTGALADLTNKIRTRGGQWDESQTNIKVLCLNGGVMNWYESTGSINFQGKDPGKATLEHEVPNLLYPDEPVTVGTPEVTISLPESNSTIADQTQTIERKYLTTGITEGELIIGIVSAVGTQYITVTNTLIDRLQGFGYTAREVRVSACLPNFKGTDEYERIKHYMQAGDSLREASENNAILAAGVAKRIRSEERRVGSGRWAEG